MFAINTDMSIHITRGDIGSIEIRAAKNENELYTFIPGDLVRFKVCQKKNHSYVVLVKDVLVETEADVVRIDLSRNDTKLGNIIDKPTVYWYEVELNPNTAPQTIIGYDVDGPKQFILYPEGGDET